MTDAAYRELLASYEAAIDAASFALKTATALAEANQRGERLSESEYQQMLGRLMRRETEIEILRENVARFKSGFRTHRRPHPLRITHLGARFHKQEGPAKWRLRLAF